MESSSNQGENRITRLEQCADKSVWKDASPKEAAEQSENTNENETKNRRNQQSPNQTRKKPITKSPKANPRVVHILRPKTMRVVHSAILAPRTTPLSTVPGRSRALIDLTIFVTAVPVMFSFNLGFFTFVAQVRRSGLIV